MNKQKYIEAGKFVERFGNWYTEEGKESGFIGTIKDLVNQMPASDVVEVVRCKECKHADLFYPYCTIWEAAIDGDGYCYKGEEEDEQNG